MGFQGAPAKRNPHVNELFISLAFLSSPERA